MQAFSRPQLLVSTALAGLLAVAGPGIAQEEQPLVAELQAEISELDVTISEAETAEARYSGGALATIAALNTETLRLARSVLEARKVAEENGAPIEITVPAVEPDPALAEEILADIQAQQERVETALAEAEGAGGLMAAMALTRYETERLSLAQLRQAWYRARYGVAFPGAGAPQAPQLTVAPQDDTETDTLPQSEAPAWADAEHPEIDYDVPVFGQFAGAGYEIVGWWGVEHSRAEIDDSPQVFAVNVSDWGGQYEVTNPSLAAGCIEGEARLIYNADDYLLSDFRSDNMSVTVRVGDAPASTERWSQLTTNQGAGLFGAPAEAMMRRLLGEEKLFLRIQERGGEVHNLSIQLAGAEATFEAIAEACQFSLLDLSVEDYRAIQTMLNAGGFDAGTPDGQWGPGSRTAMQRYQASEGLPETGAPDRETLERMGVDLEGI